MKNRIDTRYGRTVLAVVSIAWTTARCGGEEEAERPSLTQQSVTADECSASWECRTNLYPELFSEYGTRLDCEPFQGQDICMCDTTPCRDIGSGGGGSDECSSSQQCRTSLYPELFSEYGTRLDCEPFRGHDTCMCDTTPCRDVGSGGGGSGQLGRFDKGRDLLLCNYDGKPDEDDLHSVAGWATMLRDPRFSGVNYHCTAGAYGRQGGRFIDEPRLFDLAFDARWADADANWSRAVRVAADKAVQVLNSGGDVWVAEAGQSDFTADVVRRVRSQLPSVNTTRRIHVVQHSQWNEDQTTPNDLAYTRSNTDYIKIADGNTSGNGTADLHSRDGGQWNRATSDAQVGAIWREARAAASRWFGIDWDNPAIEAGGMDFSDTVEVMYIFGFGNLSGGVRGFFNEFL